MPAVLLTGPPGCGKTTIVMRVVEALGVPAGGFYTEEVRRAGKRWGFRLVTLDGREALLASVDLKGPRRVSRYGVALEALEEVGVAAVLEAARQGHLVVVDEIGKMELLSPLFRQAILSVLQGGHPVLGTVMLTSYPFADAIKGRPDVRLFLVTREGREGVFRQALEATRDMLRSRPRLT